MAKITYRGFTLIELLVVVAIISLLSSIVYANLAVARSKSIDVKKKADIAAVHTALVSFNLDSQRMPHNYDCSGGTCVVNDNRATFAIEDTQHPDDPQTESGKAYNASMQELVNGKYLSGIPHSAGGPGYVYYNYGSGSEAGAMIGTNMPSDPATVGGQPGTCRPFASQVGGGNGAAAAGLALNAGIVGDGGGHCTVYDPDTGTTQEYPLSDYHCQGLPPQDVGDEGGNQQPGGITGDGGGHCTVYDPETGNTNEYPLSDYHCQGTPPASGDEGTPNLCSAVSSSDYCMCVKF